MRIESNGQLLVTSSGTSNDTYLTLLNPDLSTDTAFGSSGVVHTSQLVSGGANSTGSANRIAVFPDGRIVLAGETGGSLSLLELTASGGLETSFGTDGQASFSLANSASGVALQQNGNIVTVGGNTLARILDQPLAPNQAPSFSGGVNQNVSIDAGTVVVANWATNISFGPPSESWQTGTFVLSNNDGGLFSSAPVVDLSGTLHYTPAAGAVGTARVTVLLKDDGGTANGGNDSSEPYAFNIVVGSQHPWQNQVNSLDVNADGIVSPIDVLIVINSLNAGGPRTLGSLTAPSGPEFYLDSSGDDVLSPLDALIILNYLNRSSVAATTSPIPNAAFATNSKINELDLAGVAYLSLDPTTGFPQLEARRFLGLSNAGPRRLISP